MSHAYAIVDDHPIAPIDVILEEARNGRMVILVNEDGDSGAGDLVLPAQMVTPAAVNFMARHGRGLVCLALTRERVEALGLPLLAAGDDVRDASAFTVSIEAKAGITTGISAGDRAHTVAVAVDAANGPDQIVMPGHVFPLMARPGGVLVRAGHTEAAVDIARLAGLNASAVVCKIMRDDGSVADMRDLVPFAQFHGLKIGTVRDLIAHRLRFDHLVERIGESAFVSEHGGTWRLLTYRNRVDGSHATILQKGAVVPGQPVLVRVHGISPLDDMLGRCGPREGLLQRAMVEIDRAGSGVIVLVAAAGDNLFRHDNEVEVRSFGIGAQVLADLGVHEMILLSNSQRTFVALDGYGLSVVGQVPIGGTPAQ